jgi:5-methylcytosine-specific restriction endonuclease McrA
MGPIGPKTRIVLLRIPGEVRQYAFDRDGRQCQHCGATKNLDFDHTIPLSQSGIRRKTCRFFVRPVAIAREISSARVDRAEFNRKAEDRGAKCYQATVELLDDSPDAETAPTE